MSDGENETDLWPRRPKPMRHLDDWDRDPSDRQTMVRIGAVVVALVLTYATYYVIGLALQ